MMFSELSSSSNPTRCSPVTHRNKSRRAIGYIGAALPDRRSLKTTGKALYASDYNPSNMVYAVPVCATIASGKIRRIDSSAAEKMPECFSCCITAISCRSTATLPAVATVRAVPRSRRDGLLLGPNVAAVIAETFEQAQAAAAAFTLTMM